MQRYTLNRPMFAVLALVATLARIANSREVHYGLAWNVVSPELRAVIDWALVALLIAATAARYVDAGKPWWRGAAWVAVLLIGAALCGDLAQWAIMPVEGVDHLDWRSDIAESVALDGVIACSVFLIWAATRRSVPPAGLRPTRYL